MEDGEQLIETLVSLLWNLSIFQALEEVLEREKRLQVEKDRLEESVAKLQVEVVQREAIAQEKEIVERKMDELEHNLRLKVWFGRDDSLNGTIQIASFWR